MDDNYPKIKDSLPKSGGMGPVIAIIDVALGGLACRTIEYHRMERQSNGRETRFFRFCS